MKIKHMVIMSGLCFWGYSVKGMEGGVAQAASLLSMLDVTGEAAIVLAMTGGYDAAELQDVLDCMSGVPLDVTELQIQNQKRTVESDSKPVTSPRRGGACNDAELLKFQKEFALSGDKEGKESDSEETGE